MKKIMIVCDCCGDEMKTTNGAELMSQLFDKGIRWEMNKEIDMPVTDLKDICEDCAVALHRAIREVMVGRKRIPAN